MKEPAQTQRCLELIGRLLYDADTDVRRAVSFALRLAARGNPVLVREFMARHVPPEKDGATWVLCDAIGSMATKLLPDFAPLLSAYETWVDDPSLSVKDRWSVESVVEKLRQVHD